ncbi:uncharacterized protein LOC115381733 isoform X1 [Salarias fasciatus]|uniref:uncharacterized protein LOC115381733 isoform X1 n=1 Tax=Salarias fasciatus TaxID=181472 RepID=UPI00117700FF|nr:uncharacterized protein LOC115381733 isoform X1 [Salarias fasciatus]
MMMTCVVILCSSVLLRLSIQEGRCCDCESSGRILGEGCSWWLGGWLGGGCGGGGFDYDVKTSDVKTSDVITAYCNVMENMRQHDRDKRFCPIRSSWTRPVVWTHIRAAVEDETVPASQLSGGGMFLVQQPRSPQVLSEPRMAEMKAAWRQCLPSSSLDSPASLRSRSDVQSWTRFCLCCSRSSERVSVRIAETSGWNRVLVLWPKQSDGN